METIQPSVIYTVYPMLLHRIDYLHKLSPLFVCMCQKHTNKQTKHASGIVPCHYCDCLCSPTANLISASDTIHSSIAPLHAEWRLCSSSQGRQLRERSCFFFTSPAWLALGKKLKAIRGNLCFLKVCKGLNLAPRKISKQSPYLPFSIAQACHLADLPKSLNIS